MPLPCNYQFFQILDPQPAETSSAPSDIQSGSNCQHSMKVDRVGEVGIEKKAHGSDGHHPIAAGIHDQQAGNNGFACDIAATNVTIDESVAAIPFTGRALQSKQRAFVASGPASTAFMSMSDIALS